MRQRLCRCCGQWHELEQWPAACVNRRPVASSDTLPVPHFISDTIEPTQSMVDGRYYTSKAAMRATYKPSGNATGESFIEVGNEWTGKPYVPPAPKDTTKEIDAALHKALARVTA